MASPEIESIQLMTQMGFPRNDPNKLVTQARIIDSESTRLSREVNGSLKLVLLYSYSTEIFKARSSGMVTYSIVFFLPTTHGASPENDPNQVTA